MGIHERDVTRQAPRELSAEEVATVDRVKAKGNEFIRLLGEIGPIPGKPRDEITIRELVLAKAKIEEAVMWAVKGITT